MLTGCTILGIFFHYPLAVTSLCAIPDALYAKIKRSKFCVLYAKERVNLMLLEEVVTCTFVLSRLQSGVDCISKVA